MHDASTKVENRRRGENKSEIKKIQEEKKKEFIEIFLSTFYLQTFILKEFDWTDCNAIHVTRWCSRSRILITNVNSNTIGPRCHCATGAVNQFSTRTNLWIASPTTSARISKQRSERERERGRRNKIHPLSATQNIVKTGTNTQLFNLYPV